MVNCRKYLPEWLGRRREYYFDGSPSRKLNINVVDEGFLNNLYF